MTYNLVSIQLQNLAKELGRELFQEKGIALLILMYASCERSGAYPRYHIPHSIPHSRKVDFCRPANLQLYSQCTRCHQTFCHLCFSLTHAKLRCISCR